MEKQPPTEQRAQFEEIKRQPSTVQWQCCHCSLVNDGEDQLCRGCGEDTRAQSDVFDDPLSQTSQDGWEEVKEAA